MFVRDRMSSPAVVATPGTTFQQALDLMQARQIRRLPIVDQDGKLVGIVSERDLMRVSPSPITQLSVWERAFVLARVHLRDIMTTEVIVTMPDASIESAAHLMVDNRIGGLPVVGESGQVVGVITETDIFKTFLEMFAESRSGLRLTLRIPPRRDALCGVSKTVFDQGGEVVSVGSFNGGPPGTKGLILKVRDANRDQLVQALEALGDQVIDAREV